MNGSPALRIAAVAFACSALAACGAATLHPQGWSAGPGGSWTQDAQTYAVSSQSFDGTITDLASQEAVNVVLREKGAKLVRSRPFSDCPGLGGLMTFRQTAAGGPELLLEAFVIRDSIATIVDYRRPASAPEDGAAMAAMRSTICHI